MKGTTGINMRRANALKVLDVQLKRGTKPEKVNGKTTDKMVPLTEYDIKRITKEMETLAGPRKKK